MSVMLIIGAWRSWNNMHDRCLNPTAENFKYYGGRGIKICDRWKDFEKFFEDMGPKPSEHYTLDRKDRNKNYTPDNCYWASKREQAQNRRSTKLTIEKVKEIKRLYSHGLYQQGELAKKFKVSGPTISAIISGRRWGNVK